MGVGFWVASALVLCSGGFAAAVLDHLRASSTARSDVTRVVSSTSAACESAIGTATPATSEPPA
jgi:hypothetical protein